MFNYNIPFHEQIKPTDPQMNLKMSHPSTKVLPNTRKLLKWGWTKKCDEVIGGIVRNIDEEEANSQFWNQNRKRNRRKLCRFLILTRF